MVRRESDVARVTRQGEGKGIDRRVCVLVTVTKKGRVCLSIPREDEPVFLRLFTRYLTLPKEPDADLVLCSSHASTTTTTKRLRGTVAFGAGKGYVQGL